MKVTCHIANMNITFDGFAKLKKDAKKEAAFSALMFLKFEVDKTTSKFNPLKKKEIYSVDWNEPHLSVMVVDSYESIYYKGIKYPENVEHVVQADLPGPFDFDNVVDAAYDYAGLFSPWRKIKEAYKIKECEEDGLRLRFYLEDEYNKLPNEIKEDGLKLIATMEEIGRAFKWHLSAYKK